MVSQLWESHVFYSINKALKETLKKIPNNVCYFMMFLEFIICRLKAEWKDCLVLKKGSLSSSKHKNSPITGLPIGELVL